MALCGRLCNGTRSLTLVLEVDEGASHAPLCNGVGGVRLRRAIWVFTLGHQGGPPRDNIGLEHCYSAKYSIKTGLFWKYRVGIRH
jgi:hypothetical protein